MRLLWSKRRWSCQEPACVRDTFVKLRPIGATRARLTTRAVAWCAEQLSSHDIAVSAAAGMLGVSRHTVWNSVVSVIWARIADPARLAIGRLHTCSIPEVAHVGRTLRRWTDEILAYFHTNGASNGPTEAIIGLVDTICRDARGFRNPEHYWLRALITAGGHRSWRTS